MTPAPFDDQLADRQLVSDALGRFLEAVYTQQPVGGLTHDFYRYPARFSPQFARAAIEAFTQPGDVVLDPFMGGATTLVEARALGRRAVGSDISSLSVFLGRVKTTSLGEDDLAHVVDWMWELPEHLNLHLPPVRAASWAEAGYQRNLPWPMRKTIELALARIHQMPRKRQQRFARCILLRVGQWALDCREHIPSAVDFRGQLIEYLDSFTKGMREFRETVKEHPVRGGLPITLSMHCQAAHLPRHARVLDSLPKRPMLVVTSPPYPGVHALYHRWQVRGRKETPACFWIADCRDGQSEIYYCLGGRKRPGLESYFDGIHSSFSAIRQVIDPAALVVQMVAFSEPDWQIPRFLESMEGAGFAEVSPKSLGLPVSDRLWRAVPGRRWFALIQGSLATSKEVVLFHRPKSA
jgi:hypothetical protein